MRPLRPDRSPPRWRSSRFWGHVLTDVALVAALVALPFAVRREALRRMQPIPLPRRVDPPGLARDIGALPGAQPAALHAAAAVLNHAGRALRLANRCREGPVAREEFAALQRQTPAVAERVRVALEALDAVERSVAPVTRGAATLRRARRVSHDRVMELRRVCQTTRDPQGVSSEECTLEDQCSRTVHRWAYDRALGGEAFGAFQQALQGFDARSIAAPDWIALRRERERLALPPSFGPSGLAVDRGWLDAAPVDAWRRVVVELGLLLGARESPLRWLVAHERDATVLPPLHVVEDPLCGETAAAPEGHTRSDAVVARIDALGGQLQRCRAAWADVRAPLTALDDALAALAAAPVPAADRGCATLTRHAAALYGSMRLDDAAPLAHTPAQQRRARWTAALATTLAALLGLWLRLPDAIRFYRAR